MNRYAEYKESGVEWIGKIPSHWNLMPTKFVSAIYCGSTPNSHIEAYWDGNINWFTPSDLGLSSTSKYINSSSRKITNAGLNSYGGEFIKPNSLVLSTRAPVGKVGISTTEFTTNQGCKVLVTKDNVDVQYLYYFFSTNTVALNVLSNGTTFGELTTKCLSSFVVLNPSFREQLQISQFLDKKTSQIDSLIEKIERKIELLKEQRTALISQCVTKGLDPNVEMKESGVEWIEEIPSHWEIGLLKHFCSHINIKRHAKNNESKISPENVESGTGKILDHQSDYENIGMEFEFGDTLLNKLRVYLAKFVFCEFSGLSMGEMIVLRPTRLDPKFQFYLLSSCRFIDHLNSLSEGVKMPRTPIDGIMKSRAPITTLREQSQISQFLDKKTSQFDSLIENLQRKIELLKEYRQSLISNVTTGKVKVTEDAS